MKSLLSLLMLLPFLIASFAHAQVSPQRWSQNYIPTLSDWQAALLFNGKTISQIGPVASNGGTMTNANISAANFTCENSLACIVSGLIRYSPSWAQSVERTLLARLEDTVSIKDFGAKGDGATDDTAAIQAAIYAVCSAPAGKTPWGSGGRIMFPPGAYFHVAGITFPCNGVTLEGVNNGNTNSGKLDYRGTVFVLHTPTNTSAYSTGMVTSDYGTGIHIENISIDGSSMAPSSTVFDFSWLQHSTIRNISAYKIQNFFREEGGAANLIEDVVILGLYGTGIEFYGDASACGTNNPTVSLAACNKRADLLRVNRVNMNGAGDHVATCYAYHDFAQSLDVTSSICESAKFGINSYCQASQGNNGEACPAFPRFIDFEAEDCTTCINVSDGQDWEFVGGYYLGQGSKSVHVAQFYNTNFGSVPTTSQLGSYANAVRIHGGRFGNAGRSVLLMGMAHFIIDDAQFFSSNLLDTDNSVGAPNIEISATGSAITPERGSIHDNLLCTAGGQQPITNPNNTSLSYMQGGIWLNAGVNYIKVHDNITVGCTGKTSDQGNGITNNSGKADNDVHNN